MIVFRLLKSSGLFGITLHRGYGFALKKVLHSTYPDNNDELMNATHSFELKRQYSLVFGIKGTMPSQQYQYAERDPIAACKNCRKQIEVELIRGEKAPEEEFTLKLPDWKDKYMVPKNLDVLQERCGDVVRFEFPRKTLSIQRTILQDRHPESVLTKRFLEIWKDEPYGKVPLEGDPDYFHHVLNFLRDGKIHLPAEILEDVFLQDLTLYNVSFSRGDISAEIDSTLIGGTIPAMKKQLDGFEKRIIKDRLQKDFDSAQLKLDGAKVAHYILSVFFQTQSLDIRPKHDDIPDSIHQILKWRSDDEIEHSVGPFLERFGLRATWQLSLWNRDLRVRLEVLYCSKEKGGD